jgi:hypothetical protein
MASMTALVELAITRETMLRSTLSLPQILSGWRVAAFDVLGHPDRDMIVPGTGMRLGDFGGGGDSARSPKPKSNKE